MKSLSSVKLPFKSPFAIFLKSENETSSNKNILYSAIRARGTVYLFFNKNDADKPANVFFFDTEFRASCVINVFGSMLFSKMESVVSIILFLVPFRDF